KLKEKDYIEGKRFEIGVNFTYYSSPLYKNIKYNLL
ncbi:hypothetical protein QOS_0498, partial [Clostridioides difficile Y184]